MNDDLDLAELDDDELQMLFRPQPLSADGGRSKTLSPYLAQDRERGASAWVAGRDSALRVADPFLMSTNTSRPSADQRIFIPQLAG